MEFINRIETIPVKLGDSRRTYLPELLQLRGKVISSIAVLPFCKSEEEYKTDPLLLQNLSLTIVSDSREIINRIPFISMSKLFTSNNNLSINKRVDFSKCYIENLSPNTKNIGLEFYFVITISDTKVRLPEYDIETVKIPALTKTTRAYFDQLDLLKGRKFISCFFNTTEDGTIFADGEQYNTQKKEEHDYLDVTAHGTGARFESPCSSFVCDDTGVDCVFIKVLNPDMWEIGDTMAIRDLIVNADEKGNLIADGSEIVRGFEQHLKVIEKHDQVLKITPINGMKGTDEMEGKYVVPTFASSSTLIRLFHPISLEGAAITIVNKDGEQIIKDLPLWCFNGTNFNNGVGVLFNEIEIDCSKSYIERQNIKDTNSYPEMQLIFMLKRE